MREFLAKWSVVQKPAAEAIQQAQVIQRLLEFTQTVHGAGKPEQIYHTLAYFLRNELGLSGIVVASSEPDATPPILIRSVWPDELAAGASLAEMDAGLCPALRQNLPREFKPDGSPVRCAIDTILGLPTQQPAHCIPFVVGRKIHCISHMLLPADQQWTEPRRNLAQAYINHAQAALTSLQLLADAEQRSMTDPLTQLYNRRSMEPLLQREVALAERHGHPMSLVMIDLDHFKQINDAHGHASGDHVLRAFADCVRITLRRTDLAFRYGGDEFVIVLPQTHIAQAQQVMHKLRQAFAAVDFTSAIANLLHHPTLSMGVAERSQANNVLTLPALLTAADQALYDAKNANRNCIRAYEPPKAA